MDMRAMMFQNMRVKCRSRLELCIWIAISFVLGMAHGIVLW